MSGIRSLYDKIGQSQSKIKKLFFNFRWMKGRYMECDESVLQKQNYYTIY